MAQRQPRRIDRVWARLFAENNLLQTIQDQGFVEIDAAQIGQVYEARLAAKFDYRHQLPAVFQQYNLSILPITRGRYVIGHFDIHHDVRYTAVRPTEVHWPPEIETINYAQLNSEAVALLCAFNSQIISDLVGEEAHYTINGRMSTQTFDFSINGQPPRTAAYNIHVANAQCEIDAGFETENYFLVVEAKLETVENFCVRQLFYPYRLWQGRIQKEVLPVLMTYSNDVFTFFVYRFADQGDFSSIRLQEQRHYRIATTAITWEDILAVYTRVHTVPDRPDIPFPQADNFGRITDLLTLLSENPNVTRENITENYAFTSRQTDYYVTAAMYLDLVERQNECVRLTQRGQTIIQMTVRERRLTMIQAMLEHEVFYRAFALIRAAGHVPQVYEIMEIMRETTTITAESTLHRRAQTAQKWLTWILDSITTDD